jgi:hypothetical protein
MVFSLYFTSISFSFNINSFVKNIIIVNTVKEQIEPYFTGSVIRILRVIDLHYKLFRLKLMVHFLLKKKNVWP